MKLIFGEDVFTKTEGEVNNITIEEKEVEQPLDLSEELKNLSKKIEELTETVDELKKEIAIRPLPNTIPIHPYPTYPTPWYPYTPTPQNFPWVFRDTTTTEDNNIYSWPNVTTWNNKISSDAIGFFNLKAID